MWPVNSGYHGPGNKLASIGHSAWYANSEIQLTFAVYAMFRFAKWNYKAPTFTLLSKISQSKESCSSQRLWNCLSNQMLCYLALRASFRCPDLGYEGLICIHTIDPLGFTELATYLGGFMHIIFWANYRCLMPVCLCMTLKNWVSQQRNRGKIVLRFQHAWVFTQRIEEIYMKICLWHFAKWNEPSVVI